jgi:hypothetical protein
LSLLSVIAGKKYVSMYLARIITTRPYEYEYQFAICESCFWCATVFHKSTIIKQEQGEDIISDSSNNDFQ